MTWKAALPIACAVFAVTLLTACGSSNKSSAPPTTATTTTLSMPSTTTTTSTSSSPSALQAEANSAATGDIPDNQVFIRFRDAPAKYSMKYPEGWAQQGNGARVTFRDKNNIVRVVVTSGAAPTAASIRSDLAHLHGVHLKSAPQPITVNGTRAFKVVYSTASPANPVTGKRVTLVVDRYYVPHAKKEAIVDLGTPVGVDNVDAYRLMIESFRWQ
jgi:hypothetical protein